SRAGDISDDEVQDVLNLVKAAKVLNVKTTSDFELALNNRAYAIYSANGEIVKAIDCLGEIRRLTNGSSEEQATFKKNLKTLAKDLLDYGNLVCIEIRQKLNTD